MLTLLITCHINAAPRTTTASAAVPSGT
jgi:hypothetical protein